MYICRCIALDDIWGFFYCCLESEYLKGWITWFKKTQPTRNYFLILIFFQFETEFPINIRLTELKDQSNKFYT